MKILVTGGSGFIGSNFIRYWMNKNPQDTIFNLDKLTYAGNKENLADIENRENYHFIKGDIGDFELVEGLIKEHQIDTIINFAAESHNSNAVLDPSIFFKTNVLGTQTLLEAARQNGNIRFHHISTCEVYGDMELDKEGAFTEESPLNSNTPYNSSKAAADLAVQSYFRTFGTPVTISNCGNNYGPYQFPEKLIPLFATNLLEGKRVPVYKSSQNKREWIHVLDHCKAIEKIVKWGRIGETYNVGTGVEKSVEEITDLILTALEKPSFFKEYVEDRPGHDKRYLLDSSKIKRELGWEPIINFEEGIKNTIKWYVENKRWWLPLKEKLKVQEGEWHKNMENNKELDKEDDVKGIILAGGNSTRLYPSTIPICKQLIPVYDKPMIYYPISTLLFAGIKDILIISTPKDLPRFKELLGDGSELGVSFSYKEQLEPKGIAEAFILGEEFIGKSRVCLILGDNIFHGTDLDELLKEAKNQKEGAVVMGYHVKDPERFGVVEFNSEEEVLSIEEKPENPKSNYAVVGLYFYDNKVIDIAKNLAPSYRGEKEITDVNKEYLKQKKLKVKIMGRGFAWLDTGTPESLTEASQYVKMLQERQGLQVGCIEEMAYKMGFMSREQLIEKAQKMKNTEYGRYLLRVAKTKKLINLDYLKFSTN